jgi:hypothetical protein
MYPNSSHSGLRAMIGDLSEAEHLQDAQRIGQREKEG